MLMRKTDSYKKHNRRHEISKNNMGVTLVELIVSFALLAVFMASATMCISHAVLFYYYERQEMAALSVADLAFSGIKDEIRTMQSSDYNGYVKIRDRDDSTNTMKGVSEYNGKYTGSCIEFVTSNIHDTATAVQIDTEGCGSDGVYPDGTTDGVFKDAKMVSLEGLVNANLQNIYAGYVTQRYYCKYPEDDLSPFKDLYMDMYCADSGAADADGFKTVLEPDDKVVWHALDKLPVASYQGFRVEMTFSVSPVDDGNGNPVVKNVDVTVDVLDDERGKVVYSKNRSIELVNTVYYYEDDTMYSDITE